MDNSMFFSLGLIACCVSGWSFAESLLHRELGFIFLSVLLFILGMFLLVLSLNVKELDVRCFDSFGVFIVDEEYFVRMTESEYSELCVEE